jgi:hypothetical protein
MTRQVGSELAGIDQHRTQLAIEALHQFLSPLLEFSITAAAVAKIADGEAINELTPGIELSDVSVDLARIEGEARRHEPDDSTPRRRSGSSLSHACNSVDA